MRWLQTSRAEESPSQKNNPPPVVPVLVRSVLRTGGGVGLERMTGYVLLQDIRDVLPSCIILIVGLAIMVLVIPYAFSSVIKQIQMENALRNITSNITKGEEQQES